MKNIIKFIPFATLTATSLGVVPLTTLISCGQSEIKMVDITNIDEDGPKFDRYTGEINDSKDAIAKFIDFAQNRYDDLVLDMQWGTWQNWMSFYNWSEFIGEQQGYGRFEYKEPKLNSLEFGMNKPTFSKVKIAPPGTPEKYHTEYNSVSFDMRSVVDGIATTCDDWYDNDRPCMETTHHVHLDVTTNIENLIMFAYLGQRNDKTLGLGLGLPAVAFQPVWLIVPHEDAEQQLIYSYNQHQFNIRYNAKLVDEVHEKQYDKEGNVIYEREFTQSGNISGDIDRANEMEEISRYKSYAWRYEGNDGINDYYSPTVGWQAWFNQSPEAFIANAIIPDMGTHYLPAETTTNKNNMILETSDNLGGSLQHNLPNISLRNWGIQLDKDHPQEQISNIQLGLGGVTDEGTFVELKDSELEIPEEGDRAVSGLFNWHYYSSGFDPQLKKPTQPSPITLKIPEKIVIDKFTGKGGKTDLIFKVNIENFSDQDYLYDPSFKPDPIAAVTDPTIVAPLQFQIPNTVLCDDDQYWPTAIKTTIEFEGATSVELITDLTASPRLIVLDPTNLTEK